MGRILIETALSSANVQLVGVLTRSGSALKGQDAGAFLGRSTGISISDNIDAVLAQAECLIDFTQPEGTLTYLPVALRHQVKLVIGTTGFSKVQRAAVELASNTCPIVLAPNMSLGVNITFSLLDLAARLLEGYDVEIIEAHHRHKVDAPSGTALKMGEMIAHAQGRQLSEVAVYDRKGVTGMRPPNAIGFATVRGGDIVGEHTALFAGGGEQIEITHKATSRLSYAKGALAAAHFLRNKTKGLFDMQDVLAQIQ
jgi:4-hydroxy-tetrahydrodipicolinate reductase